jgi:hypothetical protein
VRGPSETDVESEVRAVCDAGTQLRLGWGEESAQLLVDRRHLAERVQFLADGFDRLVASGCSFSQAIRSS